MNRSRWHELGNEWSLLLLLLLLAMDVATLRATYTAGHISHTALSCGNDHRYVRMYGYSVTMVL